MVGGQGFHLLVFDFWQGAALRWIFRDKALLHGEVVRRADHLVDVSHGFRCQPFRLLFRLDAVYPPPSSRCL